MHVILLVLITLGVNLITHKQNKNIMLFGLQNVHKINFMKVMVIITKMSTNFFFKIHRTLRFFWTRNMEIR
jgi:hypothetical protein